MYGKKKQQSKHVLNKNVKKYREKVKRKCWKGIQKKSTFNHPEEITFPWRLFHIWDCHNPLAISEVLTPILYLTSTLLPPLLTMLVSHIVANQHFSHWLHIDLALIISYTQTARLPLCSFLLVLHHIDHPQYLTFYYLVTMHGLFIQACK